ncbi:Protein SUR7 [Meyerozyma sp. JA9]|nr:Protein SUR7 [Meyerozyma sp. JA9]
MLRRIFTIVPLILLLGSTLLLVFMNIVGANNSSILGDFYWSEADTSSISKANFPKTRWTSYNMCGVKNGRNSNCLSAAPAYPFSPEDNFSTKQGIPQSFVDHRSTYYYLTRFAYVFFLIGIFFTVVALIPVALSMCLTGFVSGILSSVAVGLALLFVAAGASVMTAAHVKGRNAFRNAGMSADLGVKMFAITWAAVACLLLSLLFMCVVSGRAGARKVQRRSDFYEDKPAPARSTSSSSFDRTAVEPYASQQAEPKHFFKFRRNEV